VDLDRASPTRIRLAAPTGSEPLGILCVEETVGLPLAGQRTSTTAKPETSPETRVLAHQAGSFHGVSACTTGARATAAAAMGSAATAAKINFFMRSLLVACAGVARPGEARACPTCRLRGEPASASVFPVVCLTLAHAMQTCCKS
jgi:hypothetical protein